MQQSKHQRAAWGNANAKLTRTIELCSLIYEGMFSESGSQGLGVAMRAVQFIWAWCAIQYMNRTKIKRIRNLVCKLKSAGVWPEQLTINDFDSVNSVYLRVDIFSKKYYIGMSESTVIDRESSRRRKFRQKAHAFIEPAIRYWRSTGTFYQFVCIPLAACTDKHAALTMEHSLIHQLQPPLNMPFIGNNKRLITGMNKQGSRCSRMHFRLRCK